MDENLAHILDRSDQILKDHFEEKDHYVRQEYKPSDVKYYFPTDMGYEAKIKAWLEKLKKGE